MMVNDIKQSLCNSVDDYTKAMNRKDYHAALSHADAIKIIGLSLGSDAWNIAMDNNKRTSK